MIATSCTLSSICVQYVGWQGDAVQYSILHQQLDPNVEGRISRDQFLSAMREHFTRLEPIANQPAAIDMDKQLPIVAPEPTNQSSEKVTSEPQAVSEVDGSEHEVESDPNIEIQQELTPRLTTNEGSAHRDWQTEFELLAYATSPQDTLASGLQLASLMKEFQDQAELKLQTIVHEVTLDEDARSIPSVPQLDDDLFSTECEHVRQQIMKFSSDGLLLYVAHDPVARSTFGHQVRAAAYLQRAAKGARPPLQCLVDYLGFRAYVVPESTRTEHFTGLPVAMLRELGFYMGDHNNVGLNLRELHTLYPKIQVQEGSMEMQVDRLRPEFVSAVGQRLPIVAFADSIKTNDAVSAVYHEAQHMAADALREIVIPAFVDQVEHDATHGYDSAMITATMHREGINARLLGLCFEASRSKHTRRLFLAEMVGRICKRLLRASLQTLFKEASADVKRVARIVSGPVEEEDGDLSMDTAADDVDVHLQLPSPSEVSKEVLLKATNDVALEFLTLVLGTATVDSKQYWQDVILPQMRSRFCSSSHDDQSLVSLDALVQDELVHWPQLLDSILYHTGIDIAEGVEVRFDSSMPFIYEDISLEMKARSKLLCRTTTEVECFLGEADEAVKAGDIPAVLDRIKTDLILAHVLPDRSRGRTVARVAVRAAELCILLSDHEEAGRYLALAAHTGHGISHTRMLMVQFKLHQARGADFDQLSTLFARVVESASTAVGPAHPVLIDLFMKAASIAETFGQVGASAKYLEDAAATVKACFGRSSIPYADIRRIQGEKLMLRGEPHAEQAISMLEEALSVYEHHAQDAFDDHDALHSTKQRSAGCLYLIAMVQAWPLTTSACEIAFSTAASAFAVRSDILPPGHSDTLDSLLQLGELCVVLGDSYRALEYYRPALAILKQQQCLGDFDLERRSAVLRVVVQLHFASLGAEKQAVIERTKKRFSELVSQLSDHCTKGAECDEAARLLTFVLSQVQDNDPVEIINQLIEKTEWELHAARRQSFAINTVRRDSAAEAPVSPLCSPVSPGASRFASFALGQPPQLSIRPASPAPQSPIASSPMRASMASTVMESVAAVLTPSGEFTYGSQLTALQFLTLL